MFLIVLFLILTGLLSFQALRTPFSFSQIKHVQVTPHPGAIHHVSRKDIKAILKMSNSISEVDETGDNSLATNEKQVLTELSGEMKSAFISYAMSTILSRALPDARDGLKPVHRRVLYAMYNLGLGPDASYRKCARIVGEVLGKFHPHGDNSVYDALVRMAQDFVMMHPLIKGHGNFGSIDDDPPAAMRYTEAKLSSVAQDALLSDIKEGTVSFVSNFDGSEEEPSVLPARLPILLINGASGIAVGMATNIPPHNLAEVVDALVALVRNPEVSDEELLRLLPAPDFPTGGQIMGLEGARNLYLRGQGSIVLRATYHFETLSSGGKTLSRAEPGSEATLAETAHGKSKQAIVISELPYMTNKATLLEKIAEAVNDKRIEGISDLRDESDRDGVRIVIELKRDAILEVVMNNLFQKTALQVSFSGNLLALVDDGAQPRRLSVREALQEFIRFRFSTLRNRASHQLSKLEARAHIVEGLRLALTRIDDIITLMKQSRDTGAARASLASSFGFSEAQAEAVLALTLRRLTALEEEKLQAEQSELDERIVALKALLAQDDLVYELMVSEALDLRQKHGVARKSRIIEDATKLQLRDNDLVPNERCVVLVTKAGYVKRLSLDEFDSQSRGGRGKQGTKLSSQDDGVAHLFTCMSHDQVLFISDRGLVYKTPALALPVASRTAKGTPLPQIIALARDEKVTSAMPLSSTDMATANQFLLCLTGQGWLKKTPLEAFAKPRRVGQRLITLEADDSLRWARLCSPADEVFVATAKGYAGRFSTGTLRASGRTSRGVRSLKLRPGDSVADVDILPPRATDSSNSSSNSSNEDNRSLLLVTRRGYGKRLSVADFRPLRRGCRGVIATKFKKMSEDALLALRVCAEDNEVVVSTKAGSVIRQSVAHISSQSRQASGVKLQDIDATDAVVMVDIVP